MSKLLGSQVGMRNLEKPAYSTMFYSAGQLSELRPESGNDCGRSNGAQFFVAGLLYLDQGAEGGQELALALRPESWNFVEHGTERLAPVRAAVEADGKVMSFVADILN